MINYKDMSYFEVGLRLSRGEQHIHINNHILKLSHFQ